MMNEEPKRETDAASAPEKPETPSASKRSMSVFVYILILFSAALLLMCLSSLIHQRNNTEALGKLQSSVSVMQEVQNLQDKIITLQEARDELKTQLEQAQRAQSETSAELDAARKRVEALERLYIMEAQYQEGRYRACQGSIEAFAASGLADSLPTESPGGGAVSPLERYNQLQEATFARLHPPTVEPPPEAEP